MTKKERKERKRTRRNEKKEKNSNEEVTCKDVTSKEKASNVSHPQREGTTVPPRKITRPKLIF